MTIVINLGLHGGRISGTFITGIFTLSGVGILTFKTGIPGGLDPYSQERLKLQTSKFCSHIFIGSIIHQHFAHEKKLGKSSRGRSLKSRKFSGHS